MKRWQSVLTIFILSMTTCFLFAQSSSQDTNPSAPPPAKTANEADSTSLGGQLATESREAAGEEHENEEFKQSPSVQFVAKTLGVSVHTAYWILIIINFAIIAGLIVWFWRSKMPSAFRARTESILKQMEIARQASEDASRRLKDVESRLARLDQDIAQMKADAESAAKDEELRIQRAAEEDKKKIIESAEQEIDAAARAARAQLKNFAADLAVSLAEKQIRIDSNADQALVRGFGKQLAESRNGKEPA